jgi:hypothetical protein
MLSQEEMKAIFLPILESKGKIFAKKQNIWARVAEEGELIMTITNDGLETSNIASKGDMIVKNQTIAKEMYVMKLGSFIKRYRADEESLSDAEGFQEYKSIGKIHALLIDSVLRSELDLPEEFHFEAPWSAAMICKEDDFLACPIDFSQVYRIARKEFFETYKSA